VSQDPLHHLGIGASAEPDRRSGVPQLALPTQDFMPIAGRIGSTWLCMPSLA
jgi:hypothetical protein